MACRTASGIKANKCLRTPNERRSATSGAGFRDQRRYVSSEDLPPQRSLNAISPESLASERPKSMRVNPASFDSIIVFQKRNGVAPRFWNLVSEQPYL